jgi:hypothetical protein
MTSRKAAILPAFVLVFLVVSAAFSVSLPIEEILDRAVTEFGSGGAPLVVSVGSITFEDKNIGSSFARYFEEKFSQALQDSPAFELFARERLEEILAAIEISLTDLFDPSSVVEAGRLRGVQALIGGRYFDEGSAVTVYLSLVDVESGLVTARSEVSIPKEILPEHVSLLPDNYENALFVIEELYQVQQSDPADFEVKLWTVRGDGATYRDGEELVIHLYANRDCYVKIYQIDVQKNMQLIFPNSFFPDNFIRSGRVYKIPDSRYPFRFVLGAPYGTEFIKLVASTVQFEDIEESFEELGASSRDVITRGLSVRQREQQLFEAMIGYTIVE